MRSTFSLVLLRASLRVRGKSSFLVLTFARLLGTFLAVHADTCLTGYLPISNLNMKTFSGKTNLQILGKTEEDGA